MESLFRKPIVKVFKVSFSFSKHSVISLCNFIGPNIGSSDLDTSPPSNDILGYLGNATIDSGEESTDRRRLYLVVYDFMYSKDQEETEEKRQESKKSDLEFDNQFVDDSIVFDQLTNIIDTITPGEMGNTEEYSLIKELTSFYKTLIPGKMFCIIVYIRKKNAIFSHTIS